MRLFSKAKQRPRLTCEDVVAAYGELLQSQAGFFGDEDTLPHDAELIKAALVETARRNGGDEAIDAAKTGFVLLNNFVGKSKAIDLAVAGERAVHALLDRELNDLENEFDARLAFAKGFQHA
ncbi:hypothetical protein [Novosphingobium sp.]|uniref:hypothetical protein n=1 Tax=Novosphingobium sp. TaxID=1874826 RepID=UPI00286B1E4F|nr:hypothetical protein [Novosphingobium sp.]